MIQETVEAAMLVSNGFSTNVVGYIIFISLIFMGAFMFMCYQVFSIFKSFLHKTMEVFEKRLGAIESDVKEIKEEIKYGRK